MSQTILFEDIFNITGLNLAGKKFERVNRLHCSGTTFDVDLVVDVNAEHFQCRTGDTVAVVLASSLTGTADDGCYNPNYGVSGMLLSSITDRYSFLQEASVINLQPSLLDHYDYAMHGRVFLIKHIENQLIEVQASFGGLLFRLRGEQALIDAFTMDMPLFILMRKGSSTAMDM